MNWIDFFIGFFLMNSMPHFVLGVWKGRILSLFGFGDKQNIAYGFLNFFISISLYFYQYGTFDLAQHGIYIGAMFILVTYFITAPFLYPFFKK